jgi:hypothetical protein
MTRSAALQGTAGLVLQFSQCVCKRPFAAAADVARALERPEGPRGGAGEGACVD